jgi:hypothetical protein
MNSLARIAPTVVRLSQRMPRILPSPGVPQLSKDVVIFVDESFHLICRAFLPQSLALVNPAWFRVSAQAALKAFAFDGKNEFPAGSWKKITPHPASTRIRSERAVQGRMSRNGLH